MVQILHLLLLKFNIAFLKKHEDYTCLFGKIVCESLNNKTLFFTYFFM